jgi:hypothetical protein
MQTKIIVGVMFTLSVIISMAGLYPENTRFVLDPQTEKSREIEAAYGSVVELKVPLEHIGAAPEFDVRVRIERFEDGTFVGDIDGITWIRVDG